MRSALALLMGLSVVFKISLAQEVETMDIISSTELLKSRPHSFTPLDAGEQDAILARLKKTQQLREIQRYLAVDSGWVLHRGELLIDGNFDNAHALVVDGDVRIKGLYDDDLSATGQLLVLGDMEAENLLSWGSLAVAGALRVDGLIYTYYNDFIFEVEGEIHAEALLISDKYANFYQEKRQATIYANSDVISEDDATLRRFVPEVMAPAYADADLWDGQFYTVLPSWEACREHLYRGQSVFRQITPADTLQSALMQVSDEDSPAEELAGLVDIDPLIAMMAAFREDLPEALQDQLIASADPIVLANLANNPTVSPQRLARIAATMPSASEAVAQNPNAPSAAVESMVQSSDPEVRMAALERNDLSAASLEKLATDPDPQIREQLLWTPMVYRLSATAVDGLVADSEAKIRGILPGLDGLLQAAQLTTLAQDPDPGVREKVALALVQQALWQRSAVLDPAEREALATRLFQDDNQRVRYGVVAALPVHQQATLGKDWLARESEDRIAHHLSVELAATTRSPDLMRTYHADGDREILKGLARNPALPEPLQTTLLARLQTPQSRPQISLFDYEPWNAQRENSNDGIAEALLKNPNIHDQALIAMADYCAACDGQAQFCIDIRHQDDLPAAALTRLAEIHGVLDYHEDWALTVLLAPRATRVQIEEAFPVWHDETPLLRAFQSLANLPDPDWWPALARSEHSELRQIAAINHATPVETLLRLADDEDDEVRGHLLGNRQFPLDHPLYDAHPYARLRHPAVTDQQVQQIIQQAREAGERTVVERGWEILAARRLKAQ